MPDDNNTKKIFLLDAMALVYRAYFAFIKNPIFTSKGVNSSAIHGFANSLLEIIDKQKPDYLAVVFDTAAPTFRHKIFPDYKKGRDAMPEELSASIAPIKKFIRALGVPLIEHDGFEADDIIGSLAKKAETSGTHAMLVTPDKDFCQLISPLTKVYKPPRHGNAPEIIDLTAFKSIWQLDTPTQVIDALALRGDSSDNIPGVPGVGEKTAQKLLAEFQDLENILANTAKLKGKLRERIEENADKARLSKTLATIKTDAPCPEIDELNTDLMNSKRNDESLREVLHEFELRVLTRKLLGTKPTKSSPTKLEHKNNTSKISAKPPEPQKTEQASLFSNGTTLQKEKLAASEENIQNEEYDKLADINSVKHDYEFVPANADKRRAEIIAKLSQQKRVCFDLETTGLNPSFAKIIGVALSAEANRAFFIALPLDENYEKVLAEFAPILQNSKIEKIGHNLKYDLAILAWHNFTFNPPFFDSFIAQSLVKPGARRSMDKLAETMLDYRPIPISSLIGKDKNVKGGLLPAFEKKPQAVADYAAEDADITFQLAEKFRPIIEEQELTRVFYEIEMPLLPVLVKMERRGIKIDTDAMQKCSQNLLAKMNTLKSEIKNLAGTEFNLNSPKQLGEILFDKLKIVAKPKTTRTGQYATNEKTLESLRGRHPIIPLALEYRKAARLKNAYADSLPRAINSKSNRVHTSYAQIGAGTGRLASDHPNLQNIPIRSEEGREIRQCFIAENSDLRLISADYSQIELRIMAHLSQDQNMLKAFRNEQDIHSATAAKVYGVETLEVSQDMRRVAKTVNFGIIYGVSAFGLSQNLNIPRSDAANLIQGYFEQYPQVKEYMDESIRMARERGYAMTLGGRRISLPHIDSRNNVQRKAAERFAINAPVQGSAADMIKLAMSQIENYLEKNLPTSKLLLQVHDELVFEAPLKDISKTTTHIKKIMENAMPLSLPVKADIHHGSNWTQAH